MIALIIGYLPVVGNPADSHNLPEASGSKPGKVISVDALAVAFGC